MSTRGRYVIICVKKTLLPAMQFVVNKFFSCISVKWQADLTYFCFVCSLYKLCSNWSDLLSPFCHFSKKKKVHILARHLLCNCQILTFISAPAFVQLSDFKYMKKLALWRIIYENRVLLYYCFFPVDI